MRERAAEAAYILGWALVRHIPERAGRRAFALVADRTWRRHGAGVRQLERNLRRVTGPGVTPAQLRALSRAAMRSYLRYYYELFRLPAMGRRTVLDRTRITGLAGLEERIRSGRGVVAALPHMANWDHAGAFITLHGIPPTTVAERLRPEGVYQRFVAVREGLGLEVLPLSERGRTTARLARRLREGRLVCLVADRDLTVSGIEVTLFGEPARLPAGPAALAERTGAALLPVTLWYEGPRLAIRIHDEIAVPAHGDRAARVRAMTQELATVFEAAIADHPEDWHMLQRVFTADLDPRRPAHRDGSVEGPPAVPADAGAHARADTARATGADTDGNVGADPASPEPPPGRGPRGRR